MNEVCQQIPGRACSPDQALELAYSELELLRYRVKIHTYGERLVTSCCSLYDQNGNYLTDGLGKGIGIQSKVSAIYEALEHYLSRPICGPHLKLGDQIAWSNVRQLPCIDTLVNDKAVELLLRHHPDRELPCRAFQSFDTAQGILHPLILTVPDYFDARLPNDKFDYTQISRYSSGNGTAFGTSFVEAAVHALNERIERDAESLFYIRTFIRSSPEPLRLIDPNSLPPELKNLWDETNELAMGRLVGLDITSDLGVPTFCIMFPRPDGISYYRGCGCSLSREYALERALLEAVQDYHMYQEFASKYLEEQATFLRRLDGFPKYQKCLQGSIGELIRQGHWELTEFENIKSTQVSRCVEDHLNELLKRLAGNGFRAFYSVSYSSPSGLTCLNVLIPGLECFHLVKVGNAVLPNKRGTAALHVSRRPSGHQAD